MIKRIFDLVISISVIVIMMIPMFIIALLVRATSRGPAVHWSERVGKNNKLFLMPKFRSMAVGTPQIATHLMTDPKNHVTSVGQILRVTSLDELPQLWSVLIGNMSIVGPRPALYNQSDLILLRTQFKVHKLKPGVTGWAQVNGRDELAITEKVKFDREYMEKESFIFDLKILVMTLLKVLGSEGIRH